MTETTNPTAGNNSPTHIAFQLRDSKGKTYSTRIGAAWQHKDGKGFSIQLECLPLDGKISIRAVEEE